MEKKTLSYSAVGTIDWPGLLRAPSGYISKFLNFDPKSLQFDPKSSLPRIISTKITCTSHIMHKEKQSFPMLFNIMKIRKEYKCHQGVYLQ